MEEQKKSARAKVGLSSSFEEQNFQSFGNFPEYYLRASSPQKEREERRRWMEMPEINEEDDGNNKGLPPEDEAKSFARNDPLLRPKVRYFAILLLFHRAVLVVCLNDSPRNWDRKDAGAQCDDGHGGRLLGKRFSAMAVDR